MSSSVATSSQTFTVSSGSAGAPTITSFTPSSGVTGTSVSITGTHFQPQAYENKVLFNGAPSTVTAATSTTLTASVPSSTSSGKIQVVTPFGVATSSTDFLVPPDGSPASAIDATGRAVRTAADWRLRPPRPARSCRRCSTQPRGEIPPRCCDRQRWGREGDRSARLGHCVEHFGARDPQSSATECDRDVHGGDYRDGCDDVHDVLHRAEAVHLRSGLGVERHRDQPGRVPACVPELWRRRRSDHSGRPDEQFYSWALSVINSADVVVWSSSITSANTSFTIPALPADDSYRLILDPGYAQQSVQYNGGVTAGASTLVAGSPIQVHAGPNQPLGAYLRVPFSGTAGEYVSVTADSPSGGTGDSLVYYMSGNNRVYIGRGGICCGGHNSHNAVVFGPLPVTGTYYYLARTITTTYTHTTLERKDPAILALNGSASTLTWTNFTPQYLPIKFTATAGQAVTMKITSSACYGFGTTTYYVLVRPDRTIVSSNQVTVTSTSLGSLPSTGQYLLLLSHSSTMSGVLPEIFESGATSYSTPSTKTCSINLTSP